MGHDVKPHYKQFERIPDGKKRLNWPTSTFQSLTLFFSADFGHPKIWKHTGLNDFLMKFTGLLFEIILFLVVKAKMF